LGVDFVVDWLKSYFEDGTGMEVFASKVGILAGFVLFFCEIAILV